MTTTTRYAIELEPGKYMTDDLNLGHDLPTACLMTESLAKKVLPGYKKHWPQARIVEVKCEVQE